MGFVEKMLHDEHATAVAYLKENPGKIREAWDNWPFAPGGSLFRPLSRANKVSFGCLTQVRSGVAEACTRELTLTIRNDKVLPRRPQEIRVEHLERFAGWQRACEEYYWCGNLKEAMQRNGLSSTGKETSV